MSIDWVYKAFAICDVVVVTFAICDVVVVTFAICDVVVLTFAICDVVVVTFAICDVVFATFAICDVVVVETEVKTVLKVDFLGRECVSSLSIKSYSDLVCFIAVKRESGGGGEQVKLKKFPTAPKSHDHHQH